MIYFRFAYGSLHQCLSCSILLLSIAFNPFNECVSSGIELTNVPSKSNNSHQINDADGEQICWQIVFHFEFLIRITLIELKIQETTRD